MKRIEDLIITDEQRSILKILKSEEKYKELCEEIIKDIDVLCVDDRIKLREKRIKFLEYKILCLETAKINRG